MNDAVAILLILGICAVIGVVWDAVERCTLSQRLFRLIPIGARRAAVLIALFAGAVLIVLEVWV